MKLCVMMLALSTSLIPGPSRSQSWDQGAVNLANPQSTLSLSNYANSDSDRVASTYSLRTSPGAAGRPELAACETLPGGTARCVQLNPRLNDPSERRALARWILERCLAELNFQIGVVSFLAGGIASGIVYLANSPYEVLPRHKRKLVIASGGAAAIGLGGLFTGLRRWACGGGVAKFGDQLDPASPRSAPVDIPLDQDLYEHLRARFP